MSSAPTQIDAVSRVNRPRPKRHDIGVGGIGKPPDWLVGGDEVATKVFKSAPRRRVSDDDLVGKALYKAISSLGQIRGC